VNLKSRLQTVENANSIKSKKTILVQSPGEDIETVKRQHFGKDGVPSDVELLIVKTGVPRCRDR